MNRYKAFNVHERGYSHISKGLPRQDNSYSFSCDDYAIAIIADGHGSPQYFRSDVGSELAVKISSELITNLISRKKDARKNSENIKRFIKRDWDNAVLEHFYNNPITEAEISFLKSEIDGEDDSHRRNKMTQYLSYYLSGKLIQKAYGTTLIAVAVCDDYTLGVHIGDGTCVAFYEDGSCDQPIPADKNNMANIAGSLCNEDTGCRVYFFKKRPVAVFVASDGLDDSFGQGEQLYNYYRQLCLNIVVQNEDCFKSLQKSLSVISEKGSKDDMSIAGIYDEEHLRRLSSIISKRLKCGKLKYQLYSLQETNGGVSEYSLKAKKAKLQKAMEERLSYEMESKTLKSSLRKLRDKILRLRSVFNFDDIESVNSKISDFDKQIEQYENNLKSVNNELSKLKQKISDLEEEEQRLNCELASVKSDREQFINTSQQYYSKRNDENNETSLCESAEKKYKMAAQVEREREEDYNSARQSYLDAQTKKNELREEIEQLETEISDNISKLPSRTEQSEHVTPLQNEFDVSLNNTESLN